MPDRAERWRGAVDRKPHWLPSWRILTGSGMRSWSGTTSRYGELFDYGAVTGDLVLSEVAAAMIPLSTASGERGGGPPGEHATP
jgi:hypothetical protein